MSVLAGLMDTTSELSRQPLLDLAAVLASARQAVEARAAARAAERITHESKARAAAVPTPEQAGAVAPRQARTEVPDRIATSQVDRIRDLAADIARLKYLPLRRSASAAGSSTGNAATLTIVEHLAFNSHRALLDRVRDVGDDPRIQAALRMKWAAMFDALRVNLTTGRERILTRGKDIREQINNPELAAAVEAMGTDPTLRAVVDDVRRYWEEYEPEKRRRARDKSSRACRSETDLSTKRGR